MTHFCVLFRRWALPLRFPDKFSVWKWLIMLFETGTNFSVQISHFFFTAGVHCPLNTSAMRSHSWFFRNPKDLICSFTYDKMILSIISKHLGGRGNCRYPHRAATCFLIWVRFKGFPRVQKDLGTETQTKTFFFAKSRMSTTRMPWPWLDPRKLPWQELTLLVTYCEKFQDFESSFMITVESCQLWYENQTTYDHQFHRVVWKFPLH